MVQYTEIVGGFHQLARDWRGERAPIAAMFHDYGKRDGMPGIAAIRGESGEPGMRQTIVELGGSGLACDGDIQAVEGAASGAAGDYVSHGFAEEARQIRSHDGTRFINPRIALVRHPAPLRHRSTRGDSGGYASHLERRNQDWALSISRERQHLLQIGQIAGRNIQLIRRIFQLFRSYGEDA